MKYIPLPRPIEAIQYNIVTIPTQRGEGWDFNQDEIAKFLGRTPPLKTVFVSESNYLLEVPTRDGTSLAKDGDWIIRDQFGFSVVPAIIFDATYAPTDEEAPERKLLRECVNTIAEYRRTSPGGEEWVDSLVARAEALLG